MHKICIFTICICIFSWGFSDLSPPPVCTGCKCCCVASGQRLKGVGLFCSAWRIWTVPGQCVSRWTRIAKNFVWYGCDVKRNEGNLGMFVWRCHVCAFRECSYWWCVFVWLRHAARWCTFFGSSLDSRAWLVSCMCVYVCVCVVCVCVCVSYVCVCVFASS